MRRLSTLCDCPWTETSDPINCVVLSDSCSQRRVVTSVVTSGRRATLTSDYWARTFIIDCIIAPSSHRLIGASPALFHFFLAFSLCYLPFSLCYLPFSLCYLPISTWFSLYNLLFLTFVLLLMTAQWCFIFLFDA